MLILFFVVDVFIVFFEGNEFVLLCFVCFYNQTIIKPIPKLLFKNLIDRSYIMDFEEVMQPLYQFRMELMRRLNPNIPSVEDDLRIEYNYD